MKNERFKLLSIVFILLSFSLTFANENLLVAYLKTFDKEVTGTEVYQKDVEDVYNIYLHFYGEFDPVFEEPYAKALILKDILREKLISYLSFLENISLESFLEKHSMISDDDIKKYYLENKEEIAKDEYVDLDYAYFESKEEAEKFYKLALEKGFQKAIEETENTTYDSYNGLKKSETNEIFIDVLFGNYPDKLRILHIESGSYVFYIKANNDYSTFEKFKDSPKYNEIKEIIEKEKFNLYLDNQAKVLNIQIVATEDYKIWLDIVNGKAHKDILKEYYFKVFDKNKSIITDNPWLISGILSSIEVGNFVEEYKKEYENSLRKLYNAGYKIFSVLARLREFDKSEDVNLEYNVSLAKILLKYIENEDIMSVVQYIFQNLSELEELTNSQNKDTSLKAMEYLYYMYSALEEYETANEYYSKIIKINPNYSFERK